MIQRVADLMEQKTTTLEPPKQPGTFGSLATGLRNSVRHLQRGKRGFGVGFRKGTAPEGEGFEQDNILPSLSFSFKYHHYKKRYSTSKESFKPFGTRSRRTTFSDNEGQSLFLNPDNEGQSLTRQFRDSP